MCLCVIGAQAEASTVRFDEPAVDDVAWQFESLGASVDALAEDATPLYQTRHALHVPDMSQTGFSYAGLVTTDGGSSYGYAYQLSTVAANDLDATSDRASLAQSGAEPVAIIWNPISGSATSGCLASGCGGSGCLGSGCGGSGCLGSACGGSGCGGSGCSGSGCGGSACGASACAGSACGGSGCAGSACVGSLCGGSACVGSLCGGSACGGSACGGSACGGSGCGGSACGVSNCGGSACIASNCFGSACLDCTAEIGEETLIASAGVGVGTIAVVEEDLPDWIPDPGSSDVVTIVAAASVLGDRS
ncbi:MAG: hypothetical protein AAFR38_08690 [Planctomycetota bacterium]